MPEDSIKMKSQAAMDSAKKSNSCRGDNWPKQVSFPEMLSGYYLPNMLDIP